MRFRLNEIKYLGGFGISRFNIIKLIYVTKYLLLYRKCEKQLFVWANPWYIYISTVSIPFCNVEKNVLNSVCGFVENNIIFFLLTVIFESFKLTFAHEFSFWPLLDSFISQLCLRGESFVKLKFKPKARNCLIVTRTNCLTKKVNSKYITHAKPAFSEM